MIYFIGVEYMIQIITGSYETKNKYIRNKKYTVSDFESPKSFDKFSINIIDLSFERLWRNNESSNMNTVSLVNDLKHYKKMIETARNSKIIVIFPQNIKFKSFRDGKGGYYNSEDLKNLLNLVKALVINHIYCFNFELDFENTVTKITKGSVNADFYFDDNYIEKKCTVLVSEKSKKITTVRVTSKLYYTTLDLVNFPENLENFLIKLGIDDEPKIEMPEWVNEIVILDDLDLKEKLTQIDKQIDKNKKEKEIQLKKLENNNKIKSILYETDKNLQNEIIELLNDMLEYKDNNFIDEMEEDFRIVKENVTFIIETKGLKRNIAGTDISKTLNHVLMYQERLEENNKEENVKGIFIVATQRDKKIEEREDIPDRQIVLAERNNILIIRTETLLKLYEKFRNKEISTSKILEQFEKNSGEYIIND